MANLNSFRGGNQVYWEDELNAYWGEIFRTGLMKAEDVEHLHVCGRCKDTFLQAIRERKLKVSAEIMSNLDDKTKEEVVRIVCLHAVGSSLFS